MGRLTIRTPKGAAVKMDEPADELEARKQLMEKFHAVCEKLAYYEDLEEAGRLVVLPEGDRKELIYKALSYSDICPHHVGLKDCCHMGACKNCWETALRGSVE